MSDTLASTASHAIEVKHSRFLAQAAPVESAAQALAFLADIARTPATHHCWAYRIGNDNRSSDDGEPAGTAGRPILAAIDGQGFDRVMVSPRRMSMASRNPASSDITPIHPRLVPVSTRNACPCAPGIRLSGWNTRSRTAARRSRSDWNKGVNQRLQK